MALNNYQHMNVSIELDNLLQSQNEENLNDFDVLNLQIKKGLYPYCIVWTQIPVLRCLI